MTPRWQSSLLLVLVFGAFNSHVGAQPSAHSYAHDSFAYYGPQGLSKTWDEIERLGRDTWIFWTGGNQYFLRELGKTVGKLPRPISVDFFRLLDSRERDQRFSKYGLINEPNCEQAKKPDQYGLWLDVVKPDPALSPKRYPPEIYGESVGIVGLRKFKNPYFDPKKWDGEHGRNRYFADPASIEPPYLVGFSCAFCHMGFDPLNPPKDPSNPRWDNLAANLGNQYFREGVIMFAEGRIAFGDLNPRPRKKSDPFDPYQTDGLSRKSFLYSYAVTQQPGTSETSRISYDFINNPNTINPVFNLGYRSRFWETDSHGKAQEVFHILKDGADSIGVERALMRVWINIGMEGRYWIDHLYNPLTGQRQKPFDLDDFYPRVTQKRQDELVTKYGPHIGTFWKQAWDRNPALVKYLISYKPAYLPATYIDPVKASYGAVVFAKNCAECHSNRQPPVWWTAEEKEVFYLQSVSSSDFRVNNTLSTDARFKAYDAENLPKLRLNLARALGTNAIDADIWAQFSSREYKALPPLGRLTLDVPVFEGEQPITVEFTPPGGGRGYYRSTSLVSMWATAPYLHNNSVGDYCTVNPKTKEQNKDLVANNGTPITDPIDVSIEGRLRMFEDGVKKLLWPETRRGYIKRTLEDCNLQYLVPMMQKRLDETEKAVMSHVKDQVDANIKALLARHKDLPAAGTEKILQAFAEKTLDDVARQVHPLLDPKGYVAKLKRELEVEIDSNLRKLPPGPEGVLIRKALKEIIEASNELTTFSALTIPKGTPVNLYANLRPEHIPQAIRLSIQMRNDRRRLAKELLDLSDCPDLVEDRGHTFGAELTTPQKLALIEFLKTL